jgi:hypothetical protein
MKYLLHILLIFCCAPSIAQQRSVTLNVAPDAHARIRYGAEQLSQALKEAGYQVNASGKPAETLITLRKTAAGKTAKNEGFSITATRGKTVISGNDNSGVLYGCLELADRIRAAGRLPDSLTVTDQPEMVLRGACVGIQKTTYLPGRQVYEYPYTPENFPWFYDKALWIKYLDMLAACRMNSLYLWNGHPFASLVKLKDYPYAVEVDDATFRKNEEMYRFLTQEADKRGIWVIQMFYNIIISKPFAEKHGLKTQDRERPILPVIADYTRKSIAAFVEKYPNVGLLITLGEAMSGDDTDVEWFTRTILPGVKDGLRALGKTEEPPVVLRGHDSKPQQVLQAALRDYRNLYTMNKYNGEALTTYEPRGPWAAMHREVSRLAVANIDNVHILANLEPFRYGAPAFIRKSVQAMHTAHHANGLHLYPQASYWDWPYTADRTSPRLLQINRDRIWYETWGRYAWNCHRDAQEEDKYWSALLDKQYGDGAGKGVLEAYEQTGEIAPKLLRRFGITNGNRQTLTLGMFMSQLINPNKWKVWPELYSSDGPPGEMLITYAEKEWKHQPHEGETPVQIIREVAQHGSEAVSAIEKARPAVRRDTAEFARLRNDVYSYRALADFFAAKVQAALHVLRYRYSHDLQDLEKALPFLETSVNTYRRLAALTEGAYLYANSMQTKQRKIPIEGTDGKMKTWKELLPHYEAELQNFRKHLDSLKQGNNSNVQTKIIDLPAAKVEWQNNTGESYQPVPGQLPFSDADLRIKEITPALRNLQAVKLSRQQQKEKGTSLSFRNDRPVKLVVGFFQSKEKEFLQEPDLETDAGADNHGQAAAQVMHAVNIPSMPPVNLHTYYFEPGQHTLSLGKGVCLVLGAIDGAQRITPHDAGLGDAAGNLDWLFEE